MQEVCFFTKAKYQMNGLFLSLFLHLGHTIYSFSRERKFSIHNIVSLWFSFVVLMGVVTVELGIYQAVHKEIYNLSYQPYVYEFIGFLIFIWPFRYLDDNSTLYGMPKKNKQLQFVINFLVVVFVLYFLLLIKVYIYVSQQSLVDSYESLHDTGETLYKYSPIEEKISWIGGSLYRWFAPLIVIYTIHMMIKDKNGRNVSKSMLLLSIVFGCKFLQNVSRGGRGGVFWFIVLMIFVFLPFFKQLSKPSKRILLKIIPIIIALSFAYAATMSLLRTESSSDESPVTQVMRYLGEPYPHFGNAFWEQVNIHPMGARFYPMFWGTQNLNESYDYAGTGEYVMGVPIKNYPTMYGDFYCEFGKYGALIAIFILSMLFYIFVRKRPYTFSKYPIIYLYLQVAVTGPFWFSQRGNTGILTFLAVIIMYFVLEALTNKKQLTVRKS